MLAEYVKGARKTKHGGEEWKSSEWKTGKNLLLICSLTNKYGPCRAEPKGNQMAPVKNGKEFLKSQI